MIVKLFTQLVLATTLFQFFPADVGKLEMSAVNPDGQNYSFDLYETSQRIGKRLPLSPDRESAPKKIVPTSVGVVTSARSAIVVDRKSREVLFEKNIHESRAIGSIAKLMTAYVFLQTVSDLNANVTITSDDVRLGATLHLPVGETVTVRGLLEASLIGSDNTATAAIARLSGLPLGDFVARMNEIAATMGMQNTRFADPTGLSSDNQSVVSDLVVMFDAVMKNETIREITQRANTKVVGNSGRVYLINSTDELLTSFINEYPYKILGAKTGFIPEAGYCLGSVFSFDGSRELIIVVLGSQTKEGRFQDVKSLAVWAYQTFEWEV